MPESDVWQVRLADTDHAGIVPEEAREGALEIVVQTTSLEFADPEDKAFDAKARVFLSTDETMSRTAGAVGVRVNRYQAGRYKFVIQGCTLTRSNVFTDTEARPFVIPFVMVINDGIRTRLTEGEGKETLPAAQCFHGANACVDLKFGLSAIQGKSIWGLDALCDWRDVSPLVHSASPLAIGSLLRQAKSGTRRDFNSTVLQSLSAAAGNWFTTGSGNMVTRVGNNQNCINPPSPVPAGEGCGETPSSCGVFNYGGGLDNCRNVSLVNYLSVGQLGVDRLRSSDHGTPANPFDDVPYRATGTDHYDVLRFNGNDFSKAATECGFYDYWSFERIYFDNTYHTPGSFRESGARDRHPRRDRCGQ
jgi:hypothetical protein